MLDWSDSMSNFNRILAIVLAISMVVISFPVLAAEDAENISSDNTIQQEDAVQDPDVENVEEIPETNTDENESDLNEVSEITSSEGGSNSVEDSETTSEQTPSSAVPIVGQTEGETISISTPEELQAINNNLSGNYVLTCNIDLTNFDFKPIGSKESPFNGTFNGNGYEVQNLNMTSNKSYYGLFGYVGVSGSVMDVGVTGRIDAYEYVGGVVGYNLGTVTNCYNKASIYGNYTTGGVVGENKEGSIIDCSNQADVHNYTYEYTTDDLGGVVGTNVGGDVVNCYNTGLVKKDQNMDYDGVALCNTGGIAGSNSGAVTACYNTGQIVGDESVGGIVGENENMVTDCYNLGTVSGTEGIGGLIGYNYCGTVTNCYSTALLQSLDGAVVGYNRYDAIVSNCYYYISDADNTVGAIEGSDTDTCRGLTLEQISGDTALNSGNMEFTSSPGTWVTLANSTDEAAHLINYFTPQLSAFVKDPTDPQPDEMPTISYYQNDDGTIVPAPTLISTPEELQAIDDNLTGNYLLTCDIDMTGFSFEPIGKGAEFQGTLDGNGFEIQNLKIDNQHNDWEPLTSCYEGLFANIGKHGTVKNLGVTGSIVSDGYVGSIAGYSSGEINNCYTTANVEGYNCVGGIVGYNDGTIMDCYHKGSSIYVIYEYGGGIAGYIGKGQIINCYNEATIGSESNPDPCSKRAVGGIVGGADSEGKISSCYNIGNVYNNAGILDLYTGGIAGVSYAKIENCYNRGKIRGGEYTGGLVGENYGTVDNSYNVGLVEGASPCGGVIGANYGSASCDHLYYCIDNAGDVTGAVDGSDTETCKGLTIQQMSGETELDAGNMEFTSEPGTWIAESNAYNPNTGECIYITPRLSSCFEPVQYIQLDGNTTMDYNTTQTITATIYIRTRETSLEDSAIWSVQDNSDGGKAYISDQTDTSLTLEGIHTGTVTVTATSATDPSLSSSMKITIEKATPEVTFPTEASVTYGQKLSEASMIGEQGANCPGSFVFVDSDAMLEAADSQSSHEIQFIPEDTVNYNTVTGNYVPVTVSPKDITVIVEDVSRYYHSPNQDFTFSVPEGMLVADDTVEDLGLELKAVDENGMLVGIDAPVGEYSIEEAYSTASNYTLNVQPGVLTILSIISDPSLQFPTNVTVYHGQQLSDAHLEDAAGDGTFTFDEELMDKTMDYTDAGFYALTYTPNNSNFFTETSRVHVDVISGVNCVNIALKTPENVTEDHSTPMVMQNSYADFSTTVDGSYVQDSSVTWSIEGEHATGTTLTEVDGKQRLTIDSDEKPGKLTLRATSNQEPLISATFEIRVVQKADFDGTNIINAIDNNILQNEICKERLGENFNPFYDLDMNGKVNTQDLMVFLKVMSGIQ